MGSAKQGRTLEAGAQAPDFSLKTLAGNSPQTLGAELAQGPVLLTFFKVSCPTCQLALPFIERMYQQVQPAGTRMVAVSQDNAAETKEFQREFGITMPTLLDSEKAGYPASNAYGLTNVPSLFLVEPNGKISWSLIGFDKKELETLGEKVGAKPFNPGERVPDHKGG